jgi:hypothetical protein
MKRTTPEQKVDLLIEKVEKTARDVVGAKHAQRTILIKDCQKARRELRALAVRGLEKTISEEKQRRQNYKAAKKEPEDADGPSE